MIQARMTTRSKRSASFLAAGLVFMAAGVAFGSDPSFMVGLTVVALVVQYRNNAAPWEYLCFVALLTAMLVWGFCTNSQPSSLSSPLVGALPLMLSYVLDYLDERRQKRAASAEGSLAERASNVGRLAEQLWAAPNGGPATASGDSGAATGPSAVS